MLYDGQQFQRLDLHIKRLQRACDVLAIEAVNWAVLKDAINAAQAQFTPKVPQVLKVLISRGSGGRGYALPKQSEACAKYYLARSAYPQHYHQWQRRGITLGVSSVSLGINPLLAEIKHCNRLEQVMIKQQLNADTALAQSVDDVLVLDINHNVVECSASNVFWFKQNQWFTPCLKDAGVAGVMRQQLIEQLGITEQPVQIVKAKLDTLLNADSILICNALMGVVAVNELHHQHNIYHFDSLPVVALAHANAQECRCE
jgi:4-amino-4-deoxychorismate lyase